MALTSEERRRLYELAGELVCDHPQVARALVGAPVFARLQRQRAGRARHPFAGLRRLAARYLPMLLSLVSVPLLISGLLLDQAALIAIGALAMVNGPAIVALRRPWRRSAT